MAIAAMELRLLGKQSFGQFVWQRKGAPGPLFSFVSQDYMMCSTSTMSYHFLKWTL